MEHLQDPLSDKFFVRVVAILTPHDFWIQKVFKNTPPDANNPVIHAGIYGLFPTKTEHIQQKDEIVIRKDKLWNNTSCAWFSQFINDVTEDIVFVPKETVKTKYSIDGISTICMYGELLVYKNGKCTCVSKLLHNQRLAYKSHTQFDRYLDRNRLPVILSQDDKSFVIQKIIKVIPDFEVADHIKYWEQLMNLYQSAGDRIHQVEDAKKTMRVGLRYCGRPKHEIDFILKIKADEWNLNEEDSDSYDCIRKDLIDRKERKKHRDMLTTSAAPDTSDVVPSIGLSDTRAECESYSLYPCGMSINRRVILKKKTMLPDAGTQPPERSQSLIKSADNCDIIPTLNKVDTPREESRYARNHTTKSQNKSPPIAEFTTLTKSLSISSNSADKSYSSTSNDELTFRSTKYSKSCEGSVELESCDSRDSRHFNRATTEPRKVGYKSRLKDSQKVTSTSSNNVLRDSRNVNRAATEPRKVGYKSRLKDSRKITSTSSNSVLKNGSGHMPKTSFDDLKMNVNHQKKISPESSNNSQISEKITSTPSDSRLAEISLRNCYNKHLELPPLWVKHQDKSANDRQAAELKRLLGVPNTPDNSCDALNPGKLSDNLFEDIESDSKVPAVFPSKGCVVSKDFHLNTEENDPDIVDVDEQDDCSFDSHDSSFSRVGTFCRNPLLSNFKSMNSIFRNIKPFPGQDSEINEDISDSDYSILKSASDNSSTAVKEDSKSSGSIEVVSAYDVENEHSTGVIENNASSLMFRSQSNAFKDNSNNRLSSMGLVERILEPKVMIHSPNMLNISLWMTMGKTAFPEKIRQCLSNMNVEKPNRLQTAVWPAMMRGHSLAVIGPVNCGKTLGILAPLCSFIGDFEQLEDSNGPIGLIVVPDVKTSLAVNEICTALVHGVKVNKRYLRVLRVCVAGSYNILKIYEGCDILIITSAAFLDLFASKLPILDLSRLKMLIFDNADMMCTQSSDNVDKIYSICCTDKNLHFQVALTANRWMEQFRSLVKDFDIPVVCISAFQECIPYSRVEVVIEMLLKDDKLYFLTELLKKRAEVEWKLIILCIDTEEVLEIYDKLKSLQYSVINLTTCSNIQDVQSAQRAWDSDSCGQILICCDMNLSHINAMNATWLISYSLPRMLSTFNMRFVTMMDTYHNIFNGEPSKVPLKVDIFVDSENTNQLPKIMEFAKKCGANIPENVKLLSDKIFALQDKKRAHNGVNICDELLNSGKCTNLTHCVYRHSIIPKDVPENWIPSSGTVIFKVLAVHRPDLLAIQLLENTSLDGVVKKYDQNHVEIAFRLSSYFAMDANLRAHGHVRVNDVAAIKLQNCNTYERCRVVKICTKNVTGGPDTILVDLLESATLMEAKAYDLYYLSDDLKNIISPVVRVRITGLKPNNSGVSWSNSSLLEAKSILTTERNNLFNRANIMLAIGDTLFFKTIQCCQQMKTDNVIEVKIDYSQYLTTNQFVSENPCHLESLRQLCDKFEFKYPLKKNKLKISNITGKKHLLPEPQWAHMNENEYHEVYITSVVTPNKFFIRAIKQQGLLDSLTEDLQVYVEKRSNDIIPKKKCVDWIFEVGTHCLARFPDDKSFNRARIEKIFTMETDKQCDVSAGPAIESHTYECFFVDFGDTRTVSYEDLCPISPELVTRLPFLAIECRLCGLKNKDNEWDDASIDLLYDVSFDEINSEDLKKFYARFYKKEVAEETAGKKYAVVLYDSNNNKLISDIFLVDDLALSIKDEAKLIEKDKIDLDKWLTLQYTKNIDDDFDIVSDHPSPIPNFILQNDISLAHSSSLSSFSDLGDAEYNSKPVKKLNSDNNLDSIDFSYDVWDCHFDDEDAEQIILHSGIDKLKPIPKIEKSTIRKCATIKEIIDTSNSNITNSVSPLTKCEKVMISKDPVLTDRKTLGHNVNQKRIPHVLWYQTTTEVVLKIQLIGVHVYILDIDYKMITFRTDHENTTYEFKLNLFSMVARQNCSHENVGSCIKVKLKKLQPASWYQLMQGIDAKLNWVTYDHDHIIDSLDDENEEMEELEKMECQSKLDLIRRVHQIDMDGMESEEELVNTDTYASKISRMKREVMPFNLEDVSPDPQVLNDPLDF